MNPLIHLPDNTFYFNKGDKVRVGTYGAYKSSEDSNFGSYVYNTAVKFTPKTVIRQSSSSFNITTLSDHGFLEEDAIEVLDGQSKFVALAKEYPYATLLYLTSSPTLKTSTAVSTPTN